MWEGSRTSLPESLRVSSQWQRRRLQKALLCACVKLAERIFICVGGLLVLMEYSTIKCETNKRLLCDRACGWARFLNRKDAHKLRCQQVHEHDSYYSLSLFYLDLSVLHRDAFAELMAHDDGIAVFYASY